MSRIFAHWPRRLAWLGISVGVLLALSACAPAAPPTSDLAQDLLATQVSLALTQTAVAAAAPALPSALPSPTPLLPTPTALPIPTASPTAAPTAVPTAVPTLPPPPYDGPCTPELTTSDVTPTWGDWDSYRGYRTDGLVLPVTRYRTFALDLDNLWGGRGFGIEVYDQVEPGHLVFFVLRQVCHDYGEVTDVLVIPKPGRNQSILLTPRRYEYSNEFFEPSVAENPMGMLGLVLDIECSTPPAPFTLLQVQVDPAILPPTFDEEIRVPVQVTQGWWLDVAATQRFQPVDPHIYGACEVYLGLG